jgi:acyl dehydratase
MAYLGRVLTEWVDQRNIREMSARFVAITYPGEVLTAQGRVVAVGVDGIASRVKVDLKLLNAGGELKLTGSAIVDLS